MQKTFQNTPSTEPINSFCNGVGIGRTRFYEDLHAGRIRTVKIGRKRLVLIGEREAYLERMADK